jgi:acyl carrier protein
VNEPDIRAGVIAAIQAVAPEVEESDLVAGRALRRQIDLDSMDWLNVIVGLHDRFGIEIAEADYAQLTTLDAIVAYIGAKLAADDRAAR